ncbi:hypothetical protein ES703_54153 [subsurface metagenome]
MHIQLRQLDSAWRIPGSGRLLLFSTIKTQIRGDRYAPCGGNDPNWGHHALLNSPVSQMDNTKSILPADHRATGALIPVLFLLKTLTAQTPPIYLTLNSMYYCTKICV